MKTRNRQFAATLAGLAALAMPLVCAAEIYGWIDGAGVVTYSNLPPPNGVDVTQVIHEEPVSPKAAAAVAQQAEAAALNDRIRLLEWEVARSQRMPVDYPAVPPAAPEPPFDVGCAPYGYYDCNDWYLLNGRWWPRYGYRHRPSGVNHPGGHGRPIAPTHAAAPSSVGGHSR